MTVMKLVQLIAVFGVLVPPLAYFASAGLVVEVQDDEAAAVIGGACGLQKGDYCHNHRACCTVGAHKHIIDAAGDYLGDDQFVNCSVDGDQCGAGDCGEYFTAFRKPSCSAAR